MSTHLLPRSLDGALVVIRDAPFNAETPSPQLTPSLTPTASTYVRTNFGIPTVSETHCVEVGGAVERPMVLTVEQLRQMTQRRVTATMECAGNDRLGMRPLPVGEPWDHGAVSTVAWSGVSLAALLELAGVADDAVEVLVTAVDSGPREDAPGAVQFARAIPMADAWRPDTLLALDMNDAPLTPDHGAPVRLAVPGWYGMASVKWVSRIDVLRTPFAGYFQRQRYVYDEPSGVTAVDRMRVKSIITSPLEGDEVERVLTVEGWAWSGYGAITSVELCIDGGEEWQPAVLGEAESTWAWTPWRLDVELPRVGRVTLRTRATDSAGNVQPDAIAWNRLGYGNNAIRQCVITVT